MGRHLAVVIGLSLFIGACSHSRNTDHFTEWDFDHQVQFEQQKLGENHYQIKVISHSGTHFSRLATFLLRHSYKLCQRYDYQLTIIDGVETVDDKVARPNWIPPSLTANVDCQPK